MNRRGVSLVEVLLGILIVVIASIGTLTYFTYGVGNVGKSGNRRAALERARERLEQLMAVDPDLISPADEAEHPVTCNGGACAFGADPGPITINGIELTTASTVKWEDDPSAQTATLHDVLALSVEVWFTPNVTVHDDLNRVYIRTLRTP